MDDLINRQEMLNGLANIAKAKARSDAQKALMGRVMFFTEHIKPVSSSEKPNKSEWQQDHEILKAYSDGVNEVLAEIRVEIEEEYDKVHPYDILIAEGLERALDIIDKHMAEEGKA